jgi:hypothetical protein
MTIKQAFKSDIPELITVIQACAEDMISNGIFQWNDEYPSIEIFEKDIELNQL